MTRGIYTDTPAVTNRVKCVLTWISRHGHGGRVVGGLQVCNQTKAPIPVPVSLPCEIQSNRTECFHFKFPCTCFLSLSRLTFSISNSNDNGWQRTFENNRKVQANPNSNLRALKVGVKWLFSVFAYKMSFNAFISVFIFLNFCQYSCISLHWMTVRQIFFDGLIIVLRHCPNPSELLDHFCAKALSAFYLDNLDNL